MKKLLVMLSVLCFTSVCANAAEVPTCPTAETTPQPKAVVEKKDVNHRAHREAAFEKRLKLTEVQKLKAREIRKQGHEKLKPVMEEIKLKHQEAEVIKKSRISVQMQEEKLAVIDADLKVLEKKAAEIRKANMKEFESLLTREQKKILKEMKKEGRQKYHQGHPGGRPPMKPCPRQQSPEK